MTNPPADSGELIEERYDHRVAVVRSAIFFTPLAIASGVLLAVAGYNLLTGSIGALVPTIFLALLAFATIFEAQANLRDLRGQPRVTSGPVMRAWSKGRFLIVGRVNYLLVEGRVFEVNPVSAAEIAEGHLVHITHWPQSNTLITLHRPIDQPIRDDRESRR